MINLKKKRATRTRTDGTQLPSRLLAALAVSPATTVASTGRTGTLRVLLVASVLLDVASAATLPSASDPMLPLPAGTGRFATGALDLLIATRHFDLQQVITMKR